jgi:hypothetical protein
VRPDFAPTDTDAMSTKITELQRRYRIDPVFRHLVDHFVQLMDQGEMTGDDIFAAIDLVVAQRRTPH